MGQGAALRAGERLPCCHRAVPPPHMGLTRGRRTICHPGNQLFITLAARLGVPATACVGALIGTAQYGVPFAPNLLSLCAFRYVAFMGQPLQQPAAPAIIAMVAPPASMGAWMGTASTVQALVRALAPPVLGPLYDHSPAIPFMITSSGAAATLLFAGLLVQRVPRPHTTAGSARTSTAVGEHASASSGEMELAVADEAAGAGVSRGGSGDGERDGAAHTDHAGVELEEMGAAPALRRRWQRRRPETDAAREDMGELVVEYERLVGLMAAHEAGLLQLEEQEPPEVTDEDAAELGRWMAAMLEAQGYLHWTEHKTAIKAMIRNGFPAVRSAPTAERISDVIAVLGAHFEMERAVQDTVVGQQGHGIHTAGMYN